MKKIIIELNDDGSVNVDISSHFPKRQLLRVIRSLKLEYRNNVRKYRKIMIKKGIENGRKPEDESRVGRTEDIGRTEDSERTGTGESIKPNEAGDARTEGSKLEAIRNRSRREEADRT